MYNPLEKRREEKRREEKRREEKTKDYCCLHDAIGFMGWGADVLPS